MADQRVEVKEIDKNDNQNVMREKFLENLKSLGLNEPKKLQSVLGEALQKCKNGSEFGNMFSNKEVKEEDLKKFFFPKNHTKSGKEEIVAVNKALLDFVSKNVT